MKKIKELRVMAASLPSFDEDAVPAFSRAINKDTIPELVSEKGWEKMQRGLAEKVANLNKELITVRAAVANYEKLFNDACETKYKKLVYHAELPARRRSCARTSQVYQCRARCRGT